MDPRRLEKGRIAVQDGATLAFYATPKTPETRRVPIVLANGLGGPALAFAPQIERFARERRVITWDYRGLYGSEVRAGPADMTIAAHARDLLAILDALGEARAAVFGWSMGVQVGLEFAGLAPQRLEGLVLLNGLPGKPLDRLFGRTLGQNLPKALRNLGRSHKLSQRFLRFAVDFPYTEAVARATGLIGRHFPSEEFGRLLPEFARIDVSRYLELLDGLAEHDAESSLETLAVPTLVLGSSGDRITEPKDGRELARRIPHAEYQEISWASHYAAVEAPEQVFRSAEDFLRRRVDPNPP